MRWITLTQGQETIVDDEDYEWLSQYNWHANWNSKTRSFYAEKFGGKNRRMHRLILNAPKNIQVDHQDHNTLNNQRYNLRLCTNGQNQRNRKNNYNFKSTEYKGVSFNKPKQKYEAYIKYEGMKYSLGYFDDPFVAAMVYDRMARRLFGEFALTNGTPIF